EHFGNADAVPQLPERCLSRKAGIVRFCLKAKPQESFMDSKVFNAKSSCGCRNRLNFRLFRYTLWFVYIIVARKVPECVAKS
uniref:hypothetical protein n=1 Tax=uncultured Gemmiger sp. TaxID=1623490 RepID=UPI0025D4BA45